MANMMSYWTFSDVFEEQGIVKTPFYGGFGVIAGGNIPKASYNAFKMLHNLGNKRMNNKSDSILVTKKNDGSLAIATWNYFEPEEKGINKQVKIIIKGNKKFNHLRISLLDKDHGSALTTWEKMKRPMTPSKQQQAQLRKAGELPKPDVVNIAVGKDNTVTLNLKPHSLILLEEF